MVKLDDLFIEVCRFDIGDKVKYLPVKGWGNGRVIEVTPTHVHVRWDDRPHDTHTFRFSSLSELEIVEKADGFQRIRLKVGDRIRNRNNGWLGTIVEVGKHGPNVKYDPPEDYVHIHTSSSMLQKIEEFNAQKREHEIDGNKEAKNMEERRSLLDRINRITPFIEVEQETSTEEKTKLSLVTLVQNAVPELERDEALVTHVDMGQESIRIVVSRGKVERIQLPLPWKFGEKARDQE